MTNNGDMPWNQQPGGEVPQNPYGAPSGGGSPYGSPADQNSYGQAGQGAYGAPGQPGGQYSHGAQQPGMPAPPAGSQPQSRMVCGLLGIFLGGWGVHRFLMGYTTMGIIQIVVTLVTCGLGSIWGLIEGIMILTKSPSFTHDAYGRELTD